MRQGEKDIFDELYAALKNRHAVDSRAWNITKRAAAVGMRIYAETRLFSTGPSFAPGSDGKYVDVWSEPRLKKGRRFVAKGWEEIELEVSREEMRGNKEIKPGTGGKEKPRV